MSEPDLQCCLLVDLDPDRRCGRRSTCLMHSISYGMFHTCTQHAKSVRRAETGWIASPNSGRRYIAKSVRWFGERYPGVDGALRRLPPAQPPAQGEE